MFLVKQCKSNLFLLFLYEWSLNSSCLGGYNGRPNLPNFFQEDPQGRGESRLRPEERVDPGVRLSWLYQTAFYILQNENNEQIQENIALQNNVHIQENIGLQNNGQIQENIGLNSIISLTGQNGNRNEQHWMRFFSTINSNRSRIVLNILGGLFYGWAVVAIIMYS